MNAAVMEMPPMEMPVMAIREKVNKVETDILEIKLMLDEVEDPELDAILEKGLRQSEARESIPAKDFLERLKKRLEL
jgi:hypothetical protein